jgi:hypothetical protein
MLSANTACEKLSYLSCVVKCKVNTPKSQSLGIISQVILMLWQILISSMHYQQVDPKIEIIKPNEVTSYQIATHNKFAYYLNRSLAQTFN